MYSEAAWPAFLRAPWPPLGARPGAGGSSGSSARSGCWESLRAGSLGQCAPQITAGLEVDAAGPHYASGSHSQQLVAWLPSITFGGRTSVLVMSAIMGSRRLIAQRHRSIRRSRRPLLHCRITLRSGAAQAVATADLHDVGGSSVGGHGSSCLAAVDPEVAQLLEEERTRQIRSINLIASENFMSPEVLEVLGSVLSNKYSEGLPGARYYGGNEHIDRLERLCQKRALTAFGVSEEDWAVNVQPYSGSPANFAVYTALLQPHDRIMGLSLTCGGHLTHGHYTLKRRVSATSIYFESMPYEVEPETGLINYEELRLLARKFRPRLIIAGASAYPRIIDWGAFRSICDEVGAYLLVDMAHISGLVASGVHPSPFPFADVVTTTTHKSLRGPRGGMIFCRRELRPAIDDAVFPALQGGPHNATIGALAVQLREVATPAFHQYCADVVANCRALADYLTESGYVVATGGSDNHLLLWDLRPAGLTGSKMEKVCERVSLVLNRNALPGDKSPASPGGVRLGSCAMTTRGCGEGDFRAVGRFLARAEELAQTVQARTGKKLRDFVAGLEAEPGIEALRQEVEAWASQKAYPS